MIDAHRLTIGIDHPAITKPLAEGFRIRLVDLAGCCVVPNVASAFIQAHILPHHANTNLQRLRQRIFATGRQAENTLDDTDEPMPGALGGAGRRCGNLLQRRLKLRIAEGFGDELVHVAHAVHALELAGLLDVLVERIHLRRCHALLGKRLQCSGVDQFVQHVALG